VEIADGVHRIGPTKKGYRLGGYSQCYLFDDGGGELVLVDTGFEDDAREILAYLWQIGKTPRDIAHIALTHAHRSHLGGLRALKRLNPELTIHAHAWESDIIAGHRAAQPVPLRPLQPLKLVPLRIAALLNVPKHHGQEVDVQWAEPEGQRVHFLEVVPTPGHTPGSVSFFWRERGVLAVGDAVATWPKFDAGWPGFNLDEGRYRRSLAHLASLEPRVICPGHGGAIVTDAARRLHALVSPSA
jgi:glyoxylase-like metal-dependent hydrolase (beta-lactamase superfamily II)